MLVRGWLFSSIQELISSIDIGGGKGDTHACLSTRSRASRTYTNTHACLTLFHTIDLRFLSLWRELQPGVSVVRGCCGLGLTGCRNEGC